MKRKIGLALIVSLMITGTVFAEEISLVGKKVSGETSVFLNGTQVKNAIIVDNSSYAPVRDIAEALNVEVTFTKKSGGSSVELTTVDTKELKVKIFMAKREIDQITESIPATEKRITQSEGEFLEFYQNQLINLQNDLIIAQQNLINYTTELASITDIE